MSKINDINDIPDDLPVPEDDGAAAHLLGASFPGIALKGTDGESYNLGALRNDFVLFTYPRTGVPGQPSLVEFWDLIPGARGCTPQTCGFRDRFREFAALGFKVFGLSTQSEAYQREMAERLELPFPVLSDEAFELSDALSLPRFADAGVPLLKRLALVVENGRVIKIFYPVFPPGQNADDVLHWLKSK